MAAWAGAGPVGVVRVLERHGFGTVESGQLLAGTATGAIREFSWSGSAWTFNVISPPINTTMVHAYVLAGRNDGVQRVYSSAGDGNCYEFTYSGGAWTVQTLAPFISTSWLLPGVRAK